MRSGCSVEKWTIEKLSEALLLQHQGDKHIVVPMFQRGTSWNKEQEKLFIDSVRKGFPVGTMLFYKRIEDNREVYILVDGLQRGNTIRKYMTNPAKFYLDDGISDEVCTEILAVMSIAVNSLKITQVKNAISDYIQSTNLTKNPQYFEVARTITTIFQASFDSISAIIQILETFFEEKKRIFNTVASAEIPVVIYEGDEDNLPNIFERINSKGTPLDQYEIYAAAWPTKEKYAIQNTAVVEAIIKKYESLLLEGYSIDGYNQMELRKSHEVNAFEYLFGLSKYLSGEYEILAFETKKAADEVNSLAFELVNACLNESNKIKSLYKNIAKFKGNSRNNIKVFHPKNQILSMIACTFKEMFTESFSPKEDWIEKKDIFANNLLQYYIYDIVSNYWNAGGPAKIFKAAKSHRYLQTPSDRAWSVALDGYFESSMQRHESKKVPSPKSADYVLLNCIYLHTFTAMDQLSHEHFDIEHIAPKNQMKTMIEAAQGDGLAISCIANLCYLPEYINRSKKDRNFYQDSKYLESLNLQEVEEKYSFTKKKDLEWMDLAYKKRDDFAILKGFYEDFCQQRFAEMKTRIADALGLDFEHLTDESEMLIENVEKSIPPNFFML